MKLNRKRKDARFPNWVLELLASLQNKYQWTFTEALIRCAEKGAAYYNKQWQKIHPNEKGSPEELPASQAAERCPNVPQEDDTPNEETEYKKLNKYYHAMENQTTKEEELEKLKKRISERELTDWAEYIINGWQDYAQECLKKWGKLGEKLALEKADDLKKAGYRKK